MKRLNTFLAIAAVGVAGFAVVAQDAPRPQRIPGGQEGGAVQPRRNPQPDGQAGEAQPRRAPQPDGPRNPGNPGDPNSRREPGDRPMAAPLFAALDANGDGAIDDSEIVQAPRRLRRLDRNGDGKITPDEIGQRMGPGPGGPGDQGRPGAPRQREGGFGPEPRSPRPAVEPSREPNPGREGGPRREGASRPDGEPRREGGFGPEPGGPRPAGEPPREQSPGREGQPRPQNN